MQKRLTEIDSVSGIAIILVVFGHMYFPVFQKIAAYDLVRTFVYKIHMPLFMTLSGFIAFHSYKDHQTSNQKEYLNYIFMKFWKFFPPYVFFPVVAIVTDIFLNHSNTVDIYRSVYSWLFAPHTGSAAFVWYLYVLFLFYCILPLLYNLNSKYLLFFVICSFFLTNIYPTQLFCTDLTFKYFFFFLSGGLISLNYHDFKVYLKKTGWVYTVLFIITTLIDFNYNLSLPFQLLSVLFILTVLYLTNSTVKIFSLKLLTLLGRNTFSIYLFSSVFMNLIYQIIKFIRSEWLTPITMILLLLCGLFLPILFKLIFNRIVPPAIYKL